MKGWGSLRAPTAADVKGRGGSTKGLAAVPPPLTHLVVLDFEWTADRGKMEPCAEITQFPSVLVQLSGGSSAVVDEFDTFVRPRFNPRLTAFSIQLTAITQADVDAAPTLAEVLPRYVEWLRGHGLCEADGRRLGYWSFCTWSDADIGGTLAAECRHKALTLPACLTDWVDLKLLYKRHFKLEPRGGLQACVERLGLTFEGRAHNGLIDSRNTADIVLFMARGSGQFGPAMVFRRPTRSLDANGHAWGSKAGREAYAAQQQQPPPPQPQLQSQQQQQPQQQQQLQQQQQQQPSQPPAAASAPQILAPAAVDDFEEWALPDDVLARAVDEHEANAKRQRVGGVD